LPKSAITLEDNFLHQGNDPTFGPYGSFQGTTALIGFIGYHTPNSKDLIISYWIKVDTTSLTKKVYILKGSHISITLSKTALTCTIGTSASSTINLPSTFSNEWHLITHTIQSLTSGGIRLRSYLDGYWYNDKFSHEYSISLSLSALFRGELGLGGQNFNGKLAQVLIQAGQLPSLLPNVWETAFTHVPTPQILQLALNSTTPTNTLSTNIPIYSNGKLSLKKDPIFGDLLHITPRTSITIGLNKLKLSNPHELTIACWVKIDPNAQFGNKASGKSLTLLSNQKNTLSITVNTDQITYKLPSGINATRTTTITPNVWTLIICTASAYKDQFYSATIQAVTSISQINLNDGKTNLAETSGTAPNLYTPDINVKDFPQNPLSDLTLAPNFSGFIHGFSLWQKAINPENKDDFLAPLFKDIDEPLVIDIPLNTNTATKNTSSYTIPCIPTNLTFQEDSTFKNHFNFSKTSKISINLTHYRLTQPNLVISFWAKTNLSNLPVSSTLFADSTKYLSIKWTKQGATHEINWQIGSSTLTYPLPSINNTWKYWTFTAEIANEKISLAIWLNGKKVSYGNETFPDNSLPKLETLTLGSNTFAGSITQFKIQQQQINTANSTDFFPLFRTITNDLVLSLPFTNNTGIKDQSGNHIPIIGSSQVENHIQTDPLFGEYLQLQNGDSIRIQGTQINLSNTQEFTLALWVKLRKTPEDRGGNLLTTPTQTIPIIHSTTGIFTPLPMKGTSLTYEHVDQHLFKWNLWTYTAKVDAKKKTVNAQISIINTDGKSTVTQTIPHQTSIISLNQNDWIIGGSFTGGISNLCLWQKALSKAELQAYYLKTLEESLVVNLPLTTLPIKDISGNPIHASTANTPTISNDPIMGKALSFSSLQVNYPKLRLYNKTERTLSFWAKAPNGATLSITNKQGEKITLPNLSWKTQGQGLDQSYFNNALIGKWHYYTFIRTTKTQQIFIDGIPIIEPAWSSPNLSPLHPFTITTTKSAQIAHLKVYQTALTQEAILDEYQSLTQNITLNPLLAHIKDPSLKDYSGNNITITRNNLPTTPISDPLGIFEQCLQLTGTSSLTLNFSNILINNQTELTIDFWVLSTYTASPNFLTSTNRNFSISLPNASRQVNWAINGFSATANITPASLTGKWHHWAFVAKWIKRVLHLQIFLDGKKLLNRPQTANKGFPILNTLTFFSGFKGYIANLRVWQQALLVPQLAELIEDDQASIPNEPPSIEAEPLSFTLSNADNQAAIYITDDLGLDLELNIHNESSSPITISQLPKQAAGSFTPSPSNYHFQLRFRPNILKPNTITLNPLDKNWQLIEKLNTDQTRSLFFIYTGNVPLRLNTEANALNNKNTSPTLHLHLQNVAALFGSEGARISRVEWNYQNLKTQKTKHPIKGFLLHPLDIISHLGIQNAHIRTGFWGPNRIINNNNTPNTLIIHISNHGDKAISFLPKKSQLLLSFPTGMFGLTADQSPELDIHILDSSKITTYTSLATICKKPSEYFSTSWPKAKAAGANQAITGHSTWIISPDKHKQTLTTLSTNEQTSHLYIAIVGLTSDAQSGNSNIRVAYKDIQDGTGHAYWDASQSLTLIKSPMLSHDEEVSIHANLTLPNPTLPNNSIILDNNIASETGSLTAKQDIKTSSGNVHDQYGQVPPVGTIIMWYGSPKQIPKGWLVCNGHQYEAYNYKKLYTAIKGKPYTDISNKFNVPDLTNRFPYGTTVADIQSAQLNYMKGGNNGYTLKQSDLPDHKHTIAVNDTLSGHSHNINTEMSSSITGDCYETESKDDYKEYSNLIDGGAHSHTASMSSDCRGGANQTPITTIPPYVKVLFLIKH